MSDREKIIEAFLRSIRFQPPGGKAMFLSGEGQGRFGGIGVTLFIDFDKRKEAAIHLMHELPHLFDGKPTSDVTELLSKFLTSDFSENYDVVSGIMSQSHTQTMYDHVAQSELKNIWTALEDFLRGRRKPHLHLFPGHKIESSSDIISEDLVLIRSSSDMNTVLRTKLNCGGLNGRFFPPIERESRRNLLPERTCWLGCFTEEEKFPESRIRSIAGAIFMAGSPEKSRMFNMAQSQKGRVSLSERNCTYNFNDSVIPSLYYPIILGSAEIEFLQNILILKAGDSRIQIALKSIYEGWNCSGRERFISFAIAIDALFGVPGKVGKSILEGVSKHASGIQDIEGKTQALTQMRNDLLHGSSVSVEECPDYKNYLKSFGKEPSEDQFTILRSCLWELSGLP